MMELTIYTLVLGVTSLVTATPSGYGIRSGAFAGAHATAGAFGGFGELPLSIPSTGSYSGSFSKALSSSQASSSASSSASSFSFSGNGQIPNAIGSDGNVTPGDGGCLSGTCQSGIKGAPGYGLGGTGSGASAVAIAGAGTFGGSTANSEPCTTGACLNQNQGCSGPNCNNNLNNKKCKLGQCSPSGTAPTYYEDIPVNVVGTTANTYSANGKPTSTTYGCSNGNCGSASTPKPVYSQASAGAFPSSSGPVNKPATYLITPKEQAPCTSPNCGTPSGGAYDTEHLPSSYNVPIQGSYTEPSSPEKPPNPSYPSSSSANTDCVSGNCNKTPSPAVDFNTKKPPFSNSKDDIPDFVPLGPSASANCGTSNCVTSPSAGSKYPSYLQQASFANTASTSLGSGSNLFSGSYDATKPSSTASTGTEKRPPYTGGFGGPPGILKPNDYTLPSKIPASDYKPSVPFGTNTPTTGPLLPNNQNSSPTGLQHKPTYSPTGPSASQYQPSPSGSGSYKPPCTSGNCGNLPTTPYPIYPPYAPTGSANEPTYKPTGPSPCTSGNCEVQPFPSQSVHKPGSNNPMPCATGNCGTQPQQPGYGISTSTGSFVSPTCTTGNCGTKPTNIPSGSYKPTLPGSSKPTIPGSSFPSPCSYGNCGPTQPGLSQGGPFESPSPTGPYKPTTCTSGNCGSQSSQPSNYGQAGTSSSAITGSYNNHGQNKPYGFGGPPGVLKPNDFNTPIVSVPINKPTAPGSYNPTTCTSGNCGTQYKPSAPSNNGQYNPTASGSYNPASCTYGNCGAQSGQNSPSNNGQYNPTASGSPNPTLCSHGNCGHSPSQFGQNSGTHLPASVASANAVAYTGGFGGPPGFLKPYDDGKLVGNGLASFGNPQPVGHFGNPSVSGINSSNGKSLTGGTGVVAGAGTQAKAFLGGDYEAPDNGVSGCKDGCGSSGSGNYGLSGTAAKSQASVGAYGFGGSHATSSASAHASAGAFTKGAYGKR